MAQFSEKGSTLIMVTWIVLIITVVAGFLLYRAGLEWAITLNLEREQQMRQLAKDILAEQIAVLAADDNDFDAPEEPWFNHNGRFELKRYGFSVTLTVEDEGSKPNLNLLGEKGLGNLLGRELSPDPVLDWIDSDSELRTDGAETQYYQELHPGYLPRNGFFASLRELLQLKDGEKYFAKLAPEVTVFGKYNPNVLTPEKFGEVLLAFGFEKYWVERVTNDFRGYREKKRFANPDDLLKLPGVTLLSRDKLEPLLSFGGGCNLNFSSRSGLAALLSEAGVTADWAPEIIQHCKAQPFRNRDEIVSYFKTKNTKFKAEDYFTSTSTIFRYRIWVVKQERCFYLETVQERAPGSHKRKWEIHPLSWLELRDSAAPAAPVSVNPDSSTGGGEARDGS